MHDPNLQNGPTGALATLQGLPQSAARDNVIAALEGYQADLALLASTSQQVLDLEQTMRTATTSGADLLTTLNAVVAELDDATRGVKQVLVPSSMRRIG